MSSNYTYNDTGFWCTPTEWTYSHPQPMTDPTSNVTSYTVVTKRCLTSDDRIGLMAVTFAAMMSLVAVCYIFFMVIVRAIRNRNRQDQDANHIFQDPSDLLMISLFFADILQALGAIMDIKWIHQGNVHVGGYCDAQGIVQQLGETGVALSTLLIAVYTGSAIWLNKRIESVRYTVVAIAGIWVLIAVLVVVGNVKYREESYQIPTPYWCWIGEHYLGWKIGGEYLWFWVTLLVSLLVHVPLCWSRGRIGLRGAMWARFLISLIFYPIAYCFIIVPVSVVRFIGFYQERHGAPSHAPGWATFFVATIFSLSGLINVVLLSKTRPSSGIFARTTLFQCTQPQESGEGERSIPLTLISTL